MNEPAPSPARLTLEALAAASDERQAARLRKINRIPKARKAERVALLEESDTIYHAECAEIRAAWRHYARTGQLPA